MDRFKVINAVPNLLSLKKEGFTAVDMHFHSKFSDGLQTVTQIANRAIKLNVGVCLTDHNEILGSVALSKTNVFSIPGTEITCKEGPHMLFYFGKSSDLVGFYSNVIEMHKVKNSNFTNVPIAELIEKSRAYNSLVIVPHPHAPSWTGIMNVIRNGQINMSIFDKIDGVEAITGADLKVNNRKSTILAMNLNKGITAGTDGHMGYEMGKVVTYVEGAESAEDFIEAIRKQKSYVVGKEIDIVRKATTHGMKLPVQLNKTPNMVRHHITYSRQYLSHKKGRVKEKLKSGIDRILNGKQNLLRD